MESIIRLNHRNNTQLNDIVNQINTIIGARVLNVYNLSTSHNTDYDFGSKKEPQPKGKDASHPSHNQ